jgi:Ser/Thr protein kinase RdoA (MazF antagonist)
MSPSQETRLVDRLLRSYELDYTCLYPRQMGYRNRSFAFTRPDGTVGNLILYKSEPGILAKIRAANSVSNYLNKQGFPTRTTISSKTVCMRAPNKIKYGAVYTYLPGATIPWEGYTMKHLKVLGMALGRMHQSLALMLHPKTLPDVIREYETITVRNAVYFDSPDVRRALETKLQIVVDSHVTRLQLKLLKYAQKFPEVQVLHMDFVRSNLLFADAKGDFSVGSVVISGILDFEKTAIGLPVFDVARTLAFLLVDCRYKTALQIRHYFLYSGYLKRGGQALAHLELLEPLVNLFLTYDFYKFLRHNPYESLPDNEHFVRTRDLLASRGLITYLAPIEKTGALQIGK